MLFTSSKCREFSPCPGVVIPLYLPLAQGPFHASCHVTRLSPRGLDQTPVVSMRGEGGCCASGSMININTGGKNVRFAHRERRGRGDFFEREETHERPNL